MYLVLNCPFIISRFPIIAFMRKQLLLITLVTFLFSSLYAQIDYEIFKDSATLKAEDTGKLSVEVDNLNYLRNYEYFGDMALSHTMIGYQFMPQVKYQLNKNFLFKGGIFLRREYGRDGFVSVLPVLTAKYQKNGLSMILGTLEGALNHNFIEPIYDAESIINDRIEQGAQVILDKKRFWMDWYIDWEKAIVRYSPYREEFTSGISSKIKLVRNQNVDIDIPLQVMVAHKGGQIDTSGLPVESLLNTAIGASFLFKPNNDFLKGIRTDHYFAYYRDISGTKNQLFNEGTGWYSTLVFQSKWNLDLDIRYWKGDSFFGPRGGALYSSVSEKIPGYGEKKRELVFASLIYDKQLFPNLFLDLRLEPYYDLENEFLEYSYSVFLRFKKDFKITSLN